MKIHNDDVRVCQECRSEVVSAQTPRKSKGEFVSILVDIAEVPVESLNIATANQWALTKIGDKFHAGQATTRSQRAAMIEQSIGWHAEHTRTICKQRRESARR